MGAFGGLGLHQMFQNLARRPALLDGPSQKVVHFGAEGVQANTGNSASPVTPVQVVAKPVRTAADTGDSFLTRIGRKIRRMLSGS